MTEKTPGHQSIGGLLPAVVTPFDADDSIDAAAMRAVVETAAKPEQVRGVVVNGHMGEVMLLSPAERLEVIRLAKEVLPAGQTLVSGIAGNTVPELARQAEAAVAAGAEVLLVVPPFDVRPLQSLAADTPAVLSYFRAIGDVTDAPLIVFQYARASGIAYSLDTLEALVSLPNVAAIKAGTRDITDYVLMHDRLADRTTLLAASDGPPLLSMLLHGADGALIGISSVGTEIWSQLLAHVNADDVRAARDLFRDRCLPLMKVIYEYQRPWTPISSVSTAKEALAQLGVIPDPRFRQPAIGPDAGRRAQITETLEQVALLPARDLAS